MKNKNSIILRIGLFSCVIIFPLISLCFAEAKPSFYKNDAIFSTRPKETVSSQIIARFGPVGFAIELVQPAFKMKINRIEENSPAAKTGQLKVGQFIQSINGQVLKDIDPRIELVEILNKAESSDGVIELVVKDTLDSELKIVEVKIPVLGSYSKSWPLNCKKSDAIVRNFSTYLKNNAWKTGASELNGPAMLFMLSTGDKGDLEVVREWIKRTIDFYKTNPAPFKNWKIGYGGVPLAEYYLRTGDKAILPVIQKFADLAKQHNYLGGWAHGGTGLFKYMNGGHMNAAGTHVISFLLLAKECGVDVDEKTLQTSLKQFYRFAGRGLNPYGDGRPETGFVDNGRCGSLALAMAAAASLTPNGENSLYMRASEAAAMKSFYTTCWMNHGHTGGGIGEVWRSAAMGLLYEKRPKQYRDFMDNRKWFYNLSRRYDGSFGILGGGRYDSSSFWSYTMGLSYTIPRKTLRISGAPKSKFCIEHKLPSRPWGNETDDVFLSLKASKDKNGKIQNVENETLQINGAIKVLKILANKEVSEDTVRMYAHHQDTALRKAAAQCAAGMTPTYMFTVPSKKALFPNLVTEFLESADPRVRWTGAYSVSIIPEELLTPKNVSLLFAMVNNPAESWWVVDRALLTLAKAKPEKIAPHVDRLLFFLDHEEWWLRNSALSVLLPVMADKRFYKKIFKTLSKVIGENQRYSTLGPLRYLNSYLEKADSDVQKTALKMFAEAYTKFAPNKQIREVPNISGQKNHLELMANYISSYPGGLDELLKVSKKRFPDEKLPHKNIFLKKLGTDEISEIVKKAVNPIVLENLIPEHVARNYETLVKHREKKLQSNYPGGRKDSVDQLVSLYKKAGVSGYDWKLFGPNLRQAEWYYYTFDPIKKEQKAWDSMVSRFRRVTMPEGLKQWFSINFDPQKAGWKKGRSAFGQFMGVIPENKWTCTGPGCYCGTKINTLWDKEILLFRGKVKLPKMRNGFRYRLLVNDGNHVGTGGGYTVYVNGKIFTRGGIPKRGLGGLPKGAFITEKEIASFSDKEVDIAVISFIRYNRSYQYKPRVKEPQGRISLHFEEMKIPPFAYEQVMKAAKMVPMLSAEWQARQFLTADEKDQDGDASAKFKYKGDFLSNPTIVGEWQTVGMIDKLEDFDVSKTLLMGRPDFRRLTLNKDGSTNIPTRLWTGFKLLNLNRFEVSRIKHQKINKKEYLFIELGKFGGATGKTVGWTTPWHVMIRKSQEEKK